jgi:hypothetical protein
LDFFTTFVDTNFLKNKDMENKMIINTNKGSIEILEPKTEMLRQIRDLMPFGALQLGTPQNGAKYGLVMQCEEKEVFCIKQQPIELEMKSAHQMFNIQHWMIVEAYCKFVQHGFQGMYLACPYLRQRENELWEAGVAHFIFPSAADNNVEKLISSVFDDKFGVGTTSMFTNFVLDFRKSFEDANIKEPSYFGLDVRSRSHLQSMAMNFMTLGSDIFCVRANLREDEPAWTILAKNGIKEVYHLPSVPMTINKEDLTLSK